MIVVDSDVLIDALQGKEPSYSRVVGGLREGSLATTAITAFELLSGAKTPSEVAAIDTLLRAFSILPFDESAGRTAAGHRRQLAAKGQTIGMGDYLIAGICVSRSAALLTRNRKHFARIPDLMLAAL